MIRLRCAVFGTERKLIKLYKYKLSFELAAVKKNIYSLKHVNDGVKDCNRCWNWKGENTLCSPCRGGNKQRKRPKTHKTQLSSNYYKI